MCIEVDHRVVLVHAVDGAVSVLRVRNAISRRVLQHVISRVSLSGRRRTPTRGAQEVRRYTTFSFDEINRLLNAEGSESRNGGSSSVRCEVRERNDDGLPGGTAASAKNERVRHSDIMRTRMNRPL